MASTGFTFPGTVGTFAVGWGPTTWTNQNNITASDDSRASVSLSDFGGALGLTCSNFGFATPSGDIINGIEIRVEYARTSGPAAYSANEIYWARVVASGPDSGSGTWREGIDWTEPVTTENTVTAGSAGDPNTGSATPLTGADVNVSTFGIIFQVIGPATGGPNTYQVDAISINVHHGPPAFS